MFTISVEFEVDGTREDAERLAAEIDRAVRETMGLEAAFQGIAEKDAGRLYQGTFVI
jgi:hypothetical protein